ncbi:MAG: DUF455 family protein [Myxococcota bacterium]
MNAQAPLAGTLERWAWDYVSSTSLAHKLSPPPPPPFGEPQPAVVLEAPGRPPELRAREEKKKTPKPAALRDPAKRAQVLHTFLHHELQAAELMAWALLAWPTAPLPFRRGLVGIFKDELRHLTLYREHLETLGFPFGTHPVNDWFWKRVPGPTPAHFVARMGIGFEGGNLDHGARFTQSFEAAGDMRAAEIQALIVREEEAHAAFALHWFREFTGDLAFDSWRTYLPAPLSPLMTRGLPINLEARRRAGYPEDFLAALAAWQ